MISTGSEAEIFGRVFEPTNARMSREVAQAIAKLDFNVTDRKRMDALAEKARKGTLTKTEDHELETYIRVGHLLAIMQSKARTVLKTSAKER